MHGSLDHGSDPTSQASDPTTLPDGETPANSRGTEGPGVTTFRTRDLYGSLSRFKVGVGGHWLATFT
ncbi:hypothetical protein Hanom_Chr01g00038121 [Helianthus anomalus]